jgi:hypothetical protein
MKTSFQYSMFFPPSVEEVRAYFDQRGLPAKEAECFFLFHEFKEWKNRKGEYLQNWKQFAQNWISSLLKHEPWRFNTK